MVARVLLPMRNPISSKLTCGLTSLALLLSEINRGITEQSDRWCETNKARDTHTKDTAQLKCRALNELCPALND